MRRAVGRPGGRNGAGEQAVLERCEHTMAYVVGKRVAPPDGTTVRFVVDRRARPAGDGRRGRRPGRRLSASTGRRPTSHHVTDQETFWRLGFGRVEPARALAAGQARVGRRHRPRSPGARVHGVHDLSDGTGTGGTRARFPSRATGPTPAPVREVGTPGDRYTPLFVCERQQRPKRATRSVSPSRSTKTRWTEPSTTCMKRLSREVRVPGFRPGKVPRKVLETRMGGAVALRGEAIREALPEFYSRAVDETEVDPIDQPDIDITAGEESGPVSFEAVVLVRPTVGIPGYRGLVVTLPSLDVTDEEVTARSTVCGRLRASWSRCHARS